MVKRAFGVEAAEGAELDPPKRFWGQEIVADTSLTVEIRSVSWIDRMSAISAADIYFSILRKLTKLCKMLMNVSGKLNTASKAAVGISLSQRLQLDSETYVFSAKRISLKNS